MQNFTGPATLTCGRALAGVIDDIGREDDARGFEDADDALRQWAAQNDPGCCGGCGNWVINCTC